jgi:hypothetical protein
MLFVELA